MFTSLSTSALIVQWLLTLACDPRDRVSNQLMNLHFWFHALSEIPDVIVWIRSKDYARVAFNVIVLVCVWPWIFVAYKRVIASLREKYSVSTPQDLAGRLTTCSQSLTQPAHTLPPRSTVPPN
jgi:hypothetical protein